MILCIINNFHSTVRKILCVTIFIFLALVSTMFCPSSQVFGIPLDLSGGDPSWWDQPGKVTLRLNMGDNKFKGGFSLRSGSAELSTNYPMNTFGFGAHFFLSQGTTLDVNGSELRPLTITIKGAATITSSMANTEHGLGGLKLQDDLTLALPVDYCIDDYSTIYANNHDIYKTGIGNFIMRGETQQLKALHIQEGTVTVENIKALGNAEVILNQGTIILPEGMPLSGSLKLAEDSLLKVSPNDTTPSTLILNATDNELNGTIVFNLFSMEEYDKIQLAGVSNSSKFSVRLNVKGDDNYSDWLQIISGPNLSNIVADLVETPGWESQTDSTGFYVRKSTTDVQKGADLPEPATWLLFILGIVTIGGSQCLKYRHIHQCYDASKV